MDLVAPIGSLDPADWVNGNRAIGLKGSKVPHRAFTDANAEIVDAITRSGQTPDPDDLTQLYQAIKLIGTQDWKLRDIAGNKTTVADDHRIGFQCTAPLTVTLPAPASVGDGWIIQVRNRSTGNVTLTPGAGTINGLATMPLRTGHGGYVYSDGTNFRLIRTESPPLVAAASGQATAMSNGVSTIIPLVAPSINDLGVTWTAGDPSKLILPADVKRIGLFARGAFQLNAGGYRDIGALRNGVRSPNWTKTQTVSNDTALPAWSHPPIAVAAGDAFQLFQQQGSGIALVSDTNPALWLTGMEWI